MVATQVYKQAGRQADSQTDKIKYSGRQADSQTGWYAHLDADKACQITVPN